MTKLLVGRSSVWRKSGQADVPFATASSRDQLVYGAYKPDASTTGVLPGSVLTTYTAASQLPGGGVVGGQTYTNSRFQFVVTPPSGTSTITFRNCRFEGPATNPGSFVGLAKLFNASHCPCVFIDCTFLPQRPSRFFNGLHGHDFKAFRCDISLVVDALSVFNNNPGFQTAALGVEVWGSYLHDHAWWAFNTGDTDASGGRENSADGSHNDGCQLQGGAGFTFVGNNMQAFNHPDYFNTFYGTPQANSAFTIKPDVGVITGVDIEKNWIDGGAASINITHDEPARLLGNIGAIKANLFGRNQRNGDAWAINKHEGTGGAITWDAGTAGPPETRNLYQDTLTVVPTHIG
jgi:hypothetical protein